MLLETTTATLTAPPKPPTATTALAPGFRFHPTDEELCSYYLKRKVCNKPVRFNAISVVDIYKHEPWELADKASLKSRDQEWFFFSALDKKYGSGAKMNRATGKGYWKTTGRDREIRRDSQAVAMKKTLVFHSGRAPGGQRTDWVMHEYRLVDEQLDKVGGSATTDSYVLCRVFYKNNIGPPTGNRYAPFMEEEWEDGVGSGHDPMNELVVGQETHEMNLLEQDNHSTNKDPKTVAYSNGNDSCGGNEGPVETRNLLPVCKTEREDNCTLLRVLNSESPFPLCQYKRRKHNDKVVLNHLNASDHSTGTTQDPCSSTTTTAATTVTDAMMTTNSATTMAISALLEFSLLESKQSPHFPVPPRNSSGIESAVPPSCMRLITDLQKEIHKISVDRETLKLEMMSAQAMINILQSRIDLLNKENEDLRRIIQKDGREGSADIASNRQ